MAHRAHGPLSVAPISDRPAADAALCPPRRWTVEEAVTVEVDGSTVWDEEEARPLPAVVLRLPGHVARHLAGILDDWTTICRILESARPVDERDLASALYQAAKAADAVADAGAGDAGAAGA
jgi:hypothetical protein